MHKQRAGVVAALPQQYCPVDDTASAASRLGCFMHLLGAPRHYRHAAQCLTVETQPVSPPKTERAAS